MTKEYIEAKKAFDKLYRVHKLGFILNELDILYKGDTDLNICSKEIQEFYKQVTQSTLYKEMKANG